MFVWKKIGLIIGMGLTTFSVKAMDSWSKNFSLNVDDHTMSIDSDKQSFKLLETLYTLDEKVFYLSVSLIFVILILLIVLLRSTNRKRVNKILSKKNQEIEIHQRKVLDSISYAKSIQESFLNKKTDLIQYFPESSLFFRPKDLVSGDLFISHKKGHLKIIASIDCTGHGVPGAFMSIIAHECIKKAIDKADVLDTGTLLYDIHNLVIETLGSNINGELIKEGMDMSLCLIDEIQREIHFSGAKNSIMIKSNNELLEYHGDPISIGGMYSHLLAKTQKTKFNSHKIEFKKGDFLYLYTDGIIDQFGGANGKKLNKTGFRQMLLGYSGGVTNLDVYISEFLEKWMQGKDQIDDMLLIAIELD